MRLIRSIVACLILALPTVEAAAADKEVTPEERYELGLRYLKRGYYTKALEQFNRVRNYHRDDPISVKAELAIADVYYRQKEFDQARLAYEDFARLHPRNEDLDYVVFRIGECHFRRAPAWAGRDQTPTRQAVNTWTGFEDRFPGSEHTEEVKELLQKGRDRLAKKELRIAEFYANRAERNTGPGSDGAAWLAARRRAEGLVQKYPESEYADDALALAAEAYHAWGMTSEAQAIRERLASAYPDSKHLKGVDKVLSSPAGSQPREDTFVRPYRVSTPSSGGVGAAPQ